MLIYFFSFHSITECPENLETLTSTYVTEIVNLFGNMLMAKVQLTSITSILFFLEFFASYVFLVHFRTNTVSCEVLCQFYLCLTVVDDTD